MSESQLVIQELDFNSARARIGNDGMVLNYAYNNTPGYRIPKNAQTALIYSMQIWMGGIDSQGTLRTAFGPYNPFLSDFSPGPVSTNNMYNTSAYQTAYSESIWVIDKSEILNHIQNYNSSGYSMPQSIANWPGNGYYSLGVSGQLAPYVDINSDGVYSPQFGDYPLIKGDKMCYTILNDVANGHVFGGITTGMEIHVMAYQFESNGYLDSTTFINVKLKNRLGFDYSDFRFGFNLDSDLGNGGDDYTGCDSSRNLIYAYNMDNDDTGMFSYGVNPPAVGLVSLNRDIDKSGSYIAYGPSGYNLPIAESEIWNYMNGKWENGDNWQYGGMGYVGSTGVLPQFTNFLFSGDPYSGIGWTELTDNNPNGDRCNFMVLKPFNTAMNQEQCMDFAIIYNRHGNNLENVQGLFQIVDSIHLLIQDYSYLFCSSFEVELPSVSLNDFKIYPNPSNGNFTFIPDESWGEYTLEIRDMAGRLIRTELRKDNELFSIDLTQSKGLYFVTIYASGLSYSTKLVIK